MKTGLRLGAAAARRRPAAALIAVLAIGLAASCISATEFSPAQLKGFPRGTLSIVRKDGSDDFQIWIADTSARQQQGLMFLQELPGDRGMLFPLRDLRVMTMWMKNTYIALDMVFIGDDGRIAAIAANTTPLSTDIVSSGVAVRAVLELKGGETARRGIRPGDRVQYALFGGGT